MWDALALGLHTQFPGRLDPRLLDALPQSRAARLAMQFRLFYEGELKANGDARDKQDAATILSQSA
jgi:hypothetical protein